MSATQTAVERWQRCVFRYGEKSMPSIRAVIADDEPLARRGVRQLLAAHEDIAVVAETRNGRETVRALRELKPDLVFLDVQRSEEHTSELQSRENLVCRLLLEKKKKT